MHVPLLDLTAQYASIKQNIADAVQEVFETQRFILGPKVEACEQAVAGYSQCRQAVGVSSGSDALIISLMAAGVSHGDEVITTPYTFFATAGAIARLGARPVFVDIDPVTYNIDVKAIETVVTPKTRAVIPVHLYGQVADMDPIVAMAKQHDLVVIEDAAQAIGAEDKQRRAGSMGDAGCFSFFPSKNLGAAGDGGMVVTNREDMAERVVRLRNHGAQPKYYHELIGGNFRLDALQAAVVLTKLPHLDSWSEARQNNAQRYDRLFRASGLAVSDTSRLAEGGSGADAEVITPAVVQNRHIFNQYVIRVEKRDKLRAFLSERDVGNEVYYPVPLHLQECFSYLGYRKGDFPQSEQAAEQTLALPVYPELNDAQATYVVESVCEFIRKG